MVLWLTFGSTYIANRTATVQQVLSDGPDHKLYMNDGTVWTVNKDFSVIVGDKIRFRHDSEAIKGAPVCYLTNVTRGSETFGYRITGPKPETSCPAE